MSIHITRTPGVCGGRACIAGTRITVWILESYRRHGWTDAVLLDAYPRLTPEDLVAAWQYVAGHIDEIDHDIKENSL